MTLDRATFALFARVLAVLVVHATALWLLLPRPTSALLAPALLFGFALVGAVIAWRWLRPLSRDIRALVRILPASGGSESEASSRVAGPTYAELSEAFGALERIAQRARQIEHDDQSARAAIDEAAQLGASFLASMGHDLRGPLNNIVGFADLLVMDGLGELRGVQPSQRPSVEIIRCAAQDLLSLLEQVIAWARLQSGPLELECKPVALTTLVDAVRIETERRAASRSVALQVDRLPALTLNVDRRHVQAALLGVLDPSIRSGRSAQIELSVQLEAPSELGLRRALFVVRDRELRVRDTDHAGFFEAFRPSFAPTGQRIAGLGVGPALARALVRAHGGDVWLSSRADTGTTFTLAIPLIEEGELAGASGMPTT